VKLTTGVNLVNVFCALFCTNAVSAAYFLRMYIKKAAKTTFIQKKLAKNVDEIDNRGEKLFVTFIFYIEPYAFLPTYLCFGKFGSLRINLRHVALQSSTIFSNNLF